MPRIGQLRERVTLQRKVTADDGYGGRDVTGWTNVAKLAARVEPLKGSEEVAALRLEGRTMYQVWMRWRSGIDRATQRLAWNDNGTTRILNIRAVMNMDERRRYLRLDCEEGVAD